MSRHAICPPTSSSEAQPPPFAKFDPTADATAGHDYDGRCLLGGIVYSLPRSTPARLALAQIGKSSQTARNCEPAKLIHVRIALLQITLTARNCPIFSNHPFWDTHGGSAADADRLQIRTMRDAKSGDGTNK